MKNIGDTYSNGQKVTDLKGGIMTYYFENGEVKARGKYTDGVMQGEWIFNKKEGYLWQVGHFDDEGKQHGSWTLYTKDGSIQNEKHFEHGKRLKK